MCSDWLCYGAQGTEFGLGVDYLHRNLRGAFMREQKICLVITFHHTTDAIVLEQHFKKERLPGRLIPVPASIRAGCGLAWMAPAEANELIMSYLSQSGIGYETIGNYNL